MRQITLKIAAGQTEYVALVGDYVRIKSAAVPVRIQAENGAVDATVEDGDALNLQPFTSLLVSHSDAAEQTIALMIGNGTSADGAKVGGAVSVSGDVRTLPKGIDIASSTVALEAGAVTVIKGAELGRVLFFAQNTGAVDVALGFSNVPTESTNRLILAPGQSIMFDRVVPTGGVRAIAIGGAGQISFMNGVV